MLVLPPATCNDLKAQHTPVVILAFSISTTTRDVIINVQLARELPSNQIAVLNSIYPALVYLGPT